MQHRPFESSYLSEFEVVEQRKGKVRLYPHTDQLPKLLRAMNNEFFHLLPARLKRVDKRADGFQKFMLNVASMMFCSNINASRNDRLRLFTLLDPDTVSRVSIVQQITEDHRLGKFHRFRFYAGDDFFPEVYLSGKRLAFANHVLDRFSQRVPNNVGEDLSILLLQFYTQPLINMTVKGSKVFVISYRESILAFTYKESDQEFFITTCLSAKEIQHLEILAPVEGYNFHYGAPFIKPRTRNWSPLREAVRCQRQWEKGILAPPPHPPGGRNEWSEKVSKLKDSVVAQGYGPGTSIYFQDHIPGTCGFQLRPGQTEEQVDELGLYKELFPEHDWDAIFASEEADKAATKTT